MQLTFIKLLSRQLTCFSRSAFDCFSWEISEFLKSMTTLRLSTSWVKVETAVGEWHLLSSSLWLPKVCDDESCYSNAHKCVLYYSHELDQKVFNHLPDHWINSFWNQTVQSSAENCCLVCLRQKSGLWPEFWAHNPGNVTSVMWTL